MKLEYFNPIYTDKGYILSVDKVRYNFNLGLNQQEILNKQLYKLYDYNDYDIQLYHSHKTFDYYNLLTVKNREDKSVFQLGVGFNAVKSSDRTKCFIEFNPNKCYKHIPFILSFLKSLTYDGLDLNRFDLAIDIPFTRSSVSMFKDSRTYCKYYGLILNDSKLDNYTEYLGQRNNPGYVKLYNKTIESKLDYDLTRLEITMDSFRYDDFLKYLPSVKLNLDYTFNDLKDTDKVLYELLVFHPSKNIYLKSLGRAKQEKLSKYLFDTEDVIISESDFFKAILNIKSYCSKLSQVLKTTGFQY